MEIVIIAAEVEMKFIILIFKNLSAPVLYGATIVWNNISLGD